MINDGVTYADIEQAQKRIEPLVKRTPVFQSSLLNDWLGHDIYFKAECLQTTGAFKLRGASNFIARLIEQNCLPEHLVANSSGNHAQAVAYASRYFKTKSTIYSSKNISSVKAAATRSYGAQLRLFDTRQQADEAVKQASLHDNTVWIPPFNHPDIIAGQGTVAAEAFSQCPKIDAVFAPCGGGGLISGTFISAKAMDSNIQVVGAEPLAANDAAQSIRENKIVSLNGAVNTLADGAATPSVGEYTFPYLQQLDGFYEVNEDAIIYWTQWLQHLLKLHIEPTCAMTMQALVDWLNATQPSTKQTLLVIISGGNISAESMASIWKTNHLNDIPSLTSNI